ncbi:glycosyltransferase family 4 protein [Halorarius litoreus]|uniref:glycosyltransferase family 4 protein n=1 Tax=Halorarius litoreus TaxID=2962676 RepID=UPI0020CCC9BF|nr:glycosyltransferase family 4 protein [Halorarius litoreus]
MNIGYFFTSFPEINASGEPNRFVGGAAVVAYNLAHEMDRRGHNIEVLTTTEAKRGYNCSVPFDVYYYGSLGSVANANLSYSGALLPFFHRYDIIHIHAPSPPMDIVGSVYSRVHGTPSVVTYHAEPEATGYGSPARRAGVHLYKRAVRSIVRSADVLVSPTEKFINSSLLASHRQKVRVVPNGIDIDPSTTGCVPEKSRRILNIDPDRPVILYLNALVPQKGPDVLLRAMEDIVSHMPETLLVVAGDGPLRSDLQSHVAANGLHDNVRFEGFVDEKIKPHYYNAADLFVLPSVENHESFGLTNLEAMANGTPVIGTDVGGVSDVVADGQTGYVVAPADKDALADQIRSVLSDQTEIARLSDAAWAVARAPKYEWSTIADRVENIYQEVCKRT